MHTVILFGNVFEFVTVDVVVELPKTIKTFKPCYGVSKHGNHLEHFYSNQLQSYFVVLLFSS